jgi:4-diphosphocytidyl-2-C-methyl-D-erythritol kinase
MRTVKIKSYAKVNLTLEITGVENGYHMLDSFVANIDLYDLLVIKKRKGKLSAVTMKGMGSESIPPEKNNALKAAEAFSKAFDTDGAEITVYKNIPIGGGLGGSSADIVGVLNGMAALYGIEDRERLKSLADSLGSDTGYMLDGGFARMQGRGEKVTKLGLTNKLHFLLLCPETSVSAGECYRAYDSQPKTLEYRGSQTERCIEFIRQNDLNEGGRYLMNDLFRAAYSLNQEVGKAYEEAESFSPLGVTMSGSGSCVLAMFETKELCEWAKSRYRGKFRAFVVQTIVPDYVSACKKRGIGLRNPFVLSEEEIEEASEE